MELGENEESLAAYRASLARSTNRLNSLLGAARAAKAAGLSEEAAGYYRRVTHLRTAESQRPEFAEAEAFVSAS